MSDKFEVFGGGALGFHRLSVLKTKSLTFIIQTWIIGSKNVNK